MDTIDQKDELISAQKEVIGILFEVVKRLQKNNELDEEYLQILSNQDSKPNEMKLEEILQQRKENAEVVSRLLSQLEIES